MAKKDKKKDQNSDDFSDVFATIEKEFGSGTLIQGRDIGALVAVDIFPSGVPSIDIALGCGGIPQGRVIEIYGVESSGKTTACLQFAAACQKHYFPKKERYGRVVILDAEHALDPEWATKIGVNMDKIILSQPGNGEEALNIAERLIKSNKVDLIIVDSVAALIPKAEIDGEIGDHHVGAQARMMSQAMRKIAGACSKSKTTIIFINQVREKIGVMFGNPEVTPGGRALKFYASIRGSISKGTALKEGDTVIGFRPTIKFVKNKVAPPFTSAQFDICVGSPLRPVYGIDEMASLLDVGTRSDIGVISKGGSWFSHGDMRLGNGISNASTLLRENKELADTIREEIYNKVFGEIDNTGLEPESIDDEILDDDD